MKLLIPLSFCLGFVACIPGPCWNDPTCLRDAASRSFPEPTYLTAPEPSYVPEPSYGLAPAYDPAPAYHGGNNNSDNYSLLNLSLKTTLLSAFRSGPIAVAKPKSNMRSRMFRSFWGQKKCFRQPCNGNFGHYK